MRTRMVAIGLTLAFVIGLVLRIILVDNGIVYGGDNVALFTIALAVTSGATVVAWLAASQTSVGTAIAAVGAAISLVVAVYTTVEGLLPNTPQQAAAPACRGVPIRGAQALGQTTANGLNARSGAGTTFPQLDRYAAGCTLGFDGYCIGEPIFDDKVGVLDTRWLIVHKRHELVSSAKVLTQSRESALGTAPSSACSHYGGLPLPGSPSLQASIGTDGYVHMIATAHAATIVGYAVEIGPASAAGRYQYSLIGIKLTPQALRLSGA